MPRMQVYLPEALYKQVKSRNLPVSELLQRALQSELRRLDLLAETDSYVTDVIGDIGAPTTAQRRRADALARKIAGRRVPKAG
jgi:hypothetical protein